MPLKSFVPEAWPNVYVLLLKPIILVKVLGKPVDPHVRSSTTGQVQFIKFFQKPSIPTVVWFFRLKQMVNFILNVRRADDVAAIPAKVGSPLFSLLDLSHAHEWVCTLLTKTLQASCFPHRRCYIFFFADSCRIVYRAGELQTAKTGRGGWSLARLTSESSHCEGAASAAENLTWAHYLNPKMISEAFVLTTWTWSYALALKNDILVKYLNNRQFPTWGAQPDRGIII